MGTSMRGCCRPWRTRTQHAWPRSLPARGWCPQNWTPRASPPGFKQAGRAQGRWCRALWATERA
uniref:Uncharacterized protein n=1 Tax=Spermophilus dauricus TaxID=99837 RepID=A0A8C9UNG4_SPEDA